jgi:hypothetical protein
LDDVFCQGQIMDAEQASEGGDETARLPAEQVFRELAGFH